LPPPPRLTEKLERLAALQESGVLIDDEFSAGKAKPFE